MVQNRYTISKRKAVAMGMLTSESGLAAMAAVLAARRGERAAVLGAATMGYWRSFLASVQPLPHLYGALDLQRAAAPAAAAPALPPAGKAQAPAEAAGGPMSRAAIEAVVRQTVTAVLGVESVDAEAPLAAQGMDSLAGLELRTKIQARQLTANGWAGLAGAAVATRASWALVLGDAAGQPCSRPATPRCCRTSWAWSSCC